MHPSAALSMTFDNGHECFTKYSSIPTPLLYNFGSSHLIHSLFSFNCNSTCRCFKSCRINNTSFTTSLQATYYASVVDSVTLFCPRECQQTGTFIKWTTYPVTLIRVSLSPEKSASEYAFNSHSLLSLSSGFNFNPMFCVSNAYLITLQNLSCTLLLLCP